VMCDSLHATHPIRELTPVPAAEVAAPAAAAVAAPAAMADSGATQDGDSAALPAIAATTMKKVSFTPRRVFMPNHL